jgi:hypothetical protein
MVVAEPGLRESPRVEHLFEAIDDKRLPTQYYVQQDKLLELVDSVVCDHLIRDAVDILEIVGSFDEGPDVEIGWYGLKGSPRACGRHRMRC